MPLASIVYDFLNGDTAETIQSNYDTLSLEQVYGAITYFLGNKEEVEKDIAARERRWDEFTKTHPRSPELLEKLRKYREQMLARQMAPVRALS